jgi:hypothetical protein
MRSVRTHQGPFQRVVGRLAAVCIAFIASAVVAHASSRWATLEAIHNLENPRNSPKPGPFGELGAYQFRVTTWQMHTSLPFRQALDRRFSDLVAVEHYEYLKSRLEAARVPATPYNIALAWNGGITAAISGKAPRAAHSYAERVANLVAVFDRPPQLVALSR